MQCWIMTQDIDKKIIMLQENEKFEGSLVDRAQANSYNTLPFIKNEILTLFYNIAQKIKIVQVVDFGPIRNYI